MHSSMIPKHRQEEIVRKPTRSEKAILNMDVPQEAIVRYPRILQETSDPVVNGPKWMLASYVLYEPGKSPDPDIKGVFMIRDTPLMSSEKEALEYAEKMIRTVDSLNVYYPIQIGGPYILSNSRRFVQNEHKVATEKNLDTRQDGDANMSKMMDAVDIANVTITKDQQDDERDQLERIRKMRVKSDLMCTDGTLENYSMLRSKYENILKNCRELTKKARLLELMMKKAYETLAEIKRLDTEHPEYEDLWVEEYQETLAQSGIKADPIRELINPEDYVNETNFVRTTVATPSE